MKFVDLRLVLARVASANKRLNSLLVLRNHGSPEGLAHWFQTLNARSQPARANHNQIGTVPTAPAPRSYGQLPHSQGNGLPFAILPKCAPTFNVRLQWHEEKDLKSKPRIHRHGLCSEKWLVFLKIRINLFPPGGILIGLQRICCKKNVITSHCFLFFLSFRFFDDTLQIGVYFGKIS